MFWRAVREELQRGLGGVQPARWHVWLAEKPPGTPVQSAVWRVVALAALYGMDEGRRRMWREVHEGRAGVVQRAQVHARACFWEALQAFTRGGTMPAEGVWARVTPHHPFVHAQPHPSGPRLVARLPVGVP